MNNIRCFKGGTVETITSCDKFEAIKELIHKVPVFSGIMNIRKFENAVLKREKIQSTAVGHGIAIAHGKSRAVSNIIIALGISRNGIAFDAPDGEPIHLLFIIASPPNKYIEYLQVLSSIARLFSNEDLRNEVLSASSPYVIEQKICIAFKRTLDLYNIKASA